MGAAALLAGCDDTQTPRPPNRSPESFDPLDWDSVRAQFLLDPDLAQFAAFVLSPHTAPLQDAIDAYRQELATDTDATLLTGIEREEAVREAAAAYAGGSADQFALTDSTTMGIATMYGGLDLAPGDEVLTTTHDFYSTEASLGLLVGRTGAVVRRVSLYDAPAAASVDEMVSRLVAGVGPRTRVVAVTWVHSSTGVRLPIREMSAALASRTGAGGPVLLCVDGVHGFGAVDEDLSDLGCDWSHLTELIPTFSGTGGGAGRLTPGGYQAFEHQWAAADAFDLMGRIGRDRVASRTAEQATRLKEGLAEVGGVRVVTPLSAEVSAGIVCLEVPGLSPANSVLELRAAGVVASSTPYAVSYLRLGPSIATTPEQVDAVVSAIAELV